MDSFLSVAIQLFAVAPSRLTDTMSRLPEGSEKMIRSPSGETLGANIELVWLVSAKRLPDSVSATKSCLADPGFVCSATTIRRLSGIHENVGVPPHVGKSSKIRRAGCDGSAG